MRSRWVFQKLSPHLPSCLISPFKTLHTNSNPNPSSGTSGFVLNHLDISLLFSICAREGHLRLGSSLHASIIKNIEFLDLDNPANFRNALVVWNSLLHMYSKCGDLSDAAKVFFHMPMKDTVSWNSRISGLLRRGESEMGFQCFKQMYHSSLYRLDHATLTTVLSACDGPDLCYVMEMIHALVFSNGYERELTVGNALITSYFRCRQFNSGRRVFYEMLERNFITWTAMISGLAQNQFYEESLKLFVNMRHGVVEPNSLTYLSSLLACSGLQGLTEGKQIHGLVWKLGIHSDLWIESALMDMYSKCGSMKDAMGVFEAAEVLDEVSLTVILVGFAQNGFEEEAVHIFMKMVKAEMEIDAQVLSAVLGVFGVDTSLALGEQIHALIIKRSLASNPFVGNGLINMYSKCGDLEDSLKIFKRMAQRNSISWNSMITACACHGNGFGSLQLYEDMRSEGVEPSDVTFLSLLHACSHVGLVDKGMEFLDSMDKVYGICPRMEHYACVVDMLGRAGLLNEAKTFIEGMPIKPDILVWQALLGACGIHGDPEVGKYAADQLFLAAPDSSAAFVQMANIYSSRGRWKERARTIKRMKEKGLAKETGISWIEIEREVHSFVVGDRKHPKGERIRRVLLELFGHMGDEGYVPDMRVFSYYLNQDEEAAEGCAQFVLDDMCLTAATPVSSPRRALKNALKRFLLRFGKDGKCKSFQRLGRG
ncbi:Pentatricopeptide repeat-containing protein [Sarracenia purpurea var. burkii]